MFPFDRPRGGAMLLIMAGNNVFVAENYALFAMCFLVLVW